MLSPSSFPLLPLRGLSTLGLLSTPARHPALSPFFAGGRHLPGLAAAAAAARRAPGVSAGLFACAPPARVRPHTLTPRLPPFLLPAFTQLPHQCLVKPLLRLGSRILLIAESVGCCIYLVSFKFAHPLRPRLCASEDVGRSGLAGFSFGSKLLLKSACKWAWVIAYVFR